MKPPCHMYRNTGQRVFLLLFAQLNPIRTFPKFISIKSPTHFSLLPRWFKNVDWEEVYYKQLKPPIVPKVSYEGDTRNFDDYPETDWRQVPSVSEREYRMFEDF